LQAAQCAIDVFLKSFPALALGTVADPAGRRFSEALIRRVPISDADVKSFSLRSKRFLGVCEQRKT